MNAQEVMTATGGTNGGGESCVLVADDHESMAEAVALVLRARGLQASYTTDLRRDSLVHTVRQLRPAVVTLDLYYGAGHATTIETIGPLISLGARVVVLTGSSRRGDLAAALAAGATEVVTKGDPLAKVVEVVTVAADGRPHAGSSHEHFRAQRDIAVERLATLSGREREVLRALASGMTAAEIAAVEHRSIATIRSHIHSALTTLGVRSQLVAVALVHQAGWLDGE